MANSAIDITTIAPVPVSIVNGGTGGTTQTGGFNNLSPLTTKGNLITHSGTNNVRLVAGADGKVLVAELAQTNGIFWTEVLPWLIDIDVFSTPIDHLNTTAYQDDTYGVEMMYGGARETANASGNYMAWDVVMAAGTWTCEFRYLKASNRGIITVQVDGVSEAETIDGYNATILDDQLDSSVSITIASTGKKRIKFISTTKNASSTGFIVTLQHVQLRRTA